MKLIIIFVSRSDVPRYQGCQENRISYLDAGIVRQQASGQWLDILHQLAPELEPALQRVGLHVPCPVHGGRDGFRLFRDANETGGGICNTCGAYADGFALLIWLYGWKFPEALQAVAAAGLCLSDHHPRQRTPSRKPSTTWRKDAITQTWRTTLAPSDPRAMPLQRYLTNRGLDFRLLDSKIVRYHPRLPYWEQGQKIDSYPAMIAKITTPEGELITLHRTYLTDEGAKAPVQAPRKLMPYPQNRSLKGCAIRLAPTAQELGVAEGIETALAVQQMTAMPVWATGSATMIEHFEPPAGVSHLTIWADRDYSGRGEQAARILQKRLAARELTVSIRVPRKPIPEGASGVDWLDAMVAAKRR